ncbi:MAG: SMI1/KNR4 family protein [Chitinophagaceae bacterium]
MNWKNHLTDHIKTPGAGLQFNPAASQEKITALKAEFLLEAIPDELQSFYEYADGISSLYDNDVTDEMVWCVDTVIRINKEYRTFPDFTDLYMSFDQLLFIADSGNGDLFGYIVLQGKIERSDIFKWDHETDSRIWYAPNLAALTSKLIDEEEENTE